MTFKVHSVLHVQMSNIRISLHRLLCALRWQFWRLTIFRQTVLQKHRKWGDREPHNCPPARNVLLGLRPSLDLFSTQHTACLSLASFKGLSCHKPHLVYWSTTMSCRPERAASWTPVLRQFTRCAVSRVLTPPITLPINGLSFPQLHTCGLFAVDHCCVDQQCTTYASWKLLSYVFSFFEKKVIAVH